MDITSLEYGSLLSYASQGSSDNIERARKVMLALRTDDFIEQPPVQMSEWIARMVEQDLPRLPFASIFPLDTVLVPIPRASLSKPETLWVPHNIATALVSKRIGKEVLECLGRVEPLKKFYWTNFSDRPSPSQQYETLAIQGKTANPAPRDITLIDDIVTRGHTLLGAANRIAEAYPKARIRAFAAIRTIGDPSEFRDVYDPVLGTISYREFEDDALRKP